MSEEEEFYKWRLEQLERNHQEIFRALYGGHKDEGGIEEELRDMTRKVNELRAVMMPDSLGHGGIHKRLTRVEDFIDGKQKSRSESLKFWSPIIISVITSGALLIREWPAIYARWNHNVAELEEANKKAVHNRPRRMKKRIVVPEVRDETKKEVPERQLRDGNSVE